VWIPHGILRVKLEGISSKLLAKSQDGLSIAKEEMGLVSIGEGEECLESFYVVMAPPSGLILPVVLDEIFKGLHVIDTLGPKIIEVCIDEVPETEGAKTANERMRNLPILGLRVHRDIPPEIGVKELASIPRIEARDAGDLDSV
jgi:hypothetical protein